MGLFDMFGGKSAPEAATPAVAAPHRAESVAAGPAAANPQPAADADPQPAAAAQPAADPVPPPPPPPPTGGGAASDELQTFSEALIRQAVGMMSSDAQSHLQGMEQIYTAATARALALLADEATVAQGTVMLTQIVAAQTATATFANAIAGVAASFAKL